jgi:hypothetical protein
MAIIKKRRAAWRTSGVGGIGSLLGEMVSLRCCDLFVFVAGNASEQLPLLEADKMKAAYQAKNPVGAPLRGLKRWS